MKHKHVKRPSTKELDGKLKGAKEAISKEKRVFAQPDKVSGELNTLGLVNSVDVWKLIVQLLEEISAMDYEGKHPPEKSYEKAVEGKELFAFCWNSASMKKRMYLKFVLSEGIYYYISLHESKFKEKNEEMS